MADPAIVGWLQDEEQLRARLARNVRTRREALGLSRDTAAGSVLMDPRHWSKIESGEHGATLRTLAKLGAALGIDAVELLREPRG